MAWSLSDKERAGTAARIAANISTLAFFRGREFSDADAQEIAAAIEKKAYTAALVAARTTTGDRPAAEITSGYIR
jgi:large subunit ribosomal protein L31/Ran GTPase-activating protein 1